MLYTSKLKEVEKAVTQWTIGIIALMMTAQVRIVIFMIWCILGQNPRGYHLVDNHNQKINSLKGTEHGNEDTQNDAAGEEDAFDEDDSRPDETTQNSVDDSLLENPGNDHIHDHIHHHGNDHHTGEKEDDETHPATEGTNADKRGKTVWKNVDEIEEAALKSYDDDSYYETHELDEHQETREYSEESREGEYKYFLSYLIRPNFYITIV